MIKAIHICRCDICGLITEAKSVPGRYNETNYTCPDGWRVGITEGFHICPQCSKKLEKEEPNP